MRKPVVLITGAGGEIGHGLVTRLSGAGSIITLDETGVIRSANPTTGPFISAHRGYSAAAPENTIAALEAARLAGATVAEIDVRLCRDGELVLMHDATIDRTTDGSGPVGALSLAELRRLDAGSWFDRKFAGTPVPASVRFLISDTSVLLKPGPTTAFRGRLPK